MYIPGFAAEASLDKASGVYYGVVSGASTAGRVLPMAECCEDCPSQCYPGDCPATHPGCCTVANRLRALCLKTCVHCRTGLPWLGRL